ncbi:MAG: ATP-binding cassette domain-containing protein [bacterium]
MIQLESVSFAYPGQPLVLCNISFELHQGEAIALIGPNGSGKSTLALLLNGLLQPSSGTVRVDGLETTNPEHRTEIRRRVGLLFQNPEQQIIANTVAEEIAFGLELLNMPRAEMQTRVGELLKEFRLEAFAVRRPEELSGGEKQRLALAAIMAIRPTYLVLDEPTALLDREGREQLLSLLSSIRHQAGILFITPFPEETAFAGRLLFLSEGALREIPAQERDHFCRILENG